MGPALALEGTADGDAFGLYVRRLLVPSLRPGQVVILDQLNVHKSAAIRAAIEGPGCRLLLLPAYSPDFIPIEQIFAKIKTQLRTAAARTFERLITAIGHALLTVSAVDARLLRSLRLPAARPSPLKSAQITQPASCQWRPCRDGSSSPVAASESTLL